MPHDDHFVEVIRISAELEALEGRVEEVIFPVFLCALIEREV